MNVEVGADVKTLDLGEVDGRVEIVGEDARRPSRARAVPRCVGGSEADVQAGGRGGAAALTLERRRRPPGVRRRRTRTSGGSAAAGARARHRPAAEGAGAPRRRRSACPGVADVQGVAGVHARERARGSVTLRDIAGRRRRASSATACWRSRAPRSVDVETRRVNLRLERRRRRGRGRGDDGGIEAQGPRRQDDAEDPARRRAADGPVGTAEHRGPGRPRRRARARAPTLTFDGTRLAAAVEMREAGPRHGRDHRRLRGGRAAAPAALTLKLEANEGSVAGARRAPGRRARAARRRRSRPRSRGGGPLRRR